MSVEQLRADAQAAVVRAGYDRAARRLDAPTSVTAVAGVLDTIGEVVDPYGCDVLDSAAIEALGWLLIALAAPPTRAR